MPAVKVLARDWKLTINTGTSASPIWTPIGGLNSLTFTSGKKDAETTDFDSLGFEESFVASRSRGLKGEGFYLEDLTSKARDAGQKAIDDASDLVGPASVKQFKLQSPAGNIKSFNATVNTGDIGGGNDDPTKWGFELQVTGKPTYS